MIVTLTLNPAIDRNITVDRLAFEDRAYILDKNESAGGRGINAACVIHSFGGDALAILTAGLTSYAFVVHRRQRLRTMSNRCLTCGYDLRATTSGRCPECGTPNSAALTAK